MENENIQRIEELFNTPQGSIEDGLFWLALFVWGIVTLVHAVRDIDNIESDRFSVSSLVKFIKKDKYTVVDVVWGIIRIPSWTLQILIGAVTLPIVKLIGIIIKGFKASAPRLLKLGKVLSFPVVKVLNTVVYKKKS